LQVLRRAWRHNEQGKGELVLRDELGKPFWGTPGRYLPKSMLLAFVDELGQNYQELLQGATSFRSGESAL
jgi:hypothetical protein